MLRGASAEEREIRTLHRELGTLLRESSLEQLRKVALVLGKSPAWLDLVHLDAKNPGVVGRACLRAAR